MLLIRFTIRSISVIVYHHPSSSYRPVTSISVEGKWFCLYLCACLCLFALVWRLLYCFFFLLIVSLFFFSDFPFPFILQLVVSCGLVSCFCHHFVCFTPFIFLRSSCGTMSLGPTCVPPASTESQSTLKCFRFLEISLNRDPEESIA